MLGAATQANAQALPIPIPIGVEEFLPLDVEEDIADPPIDFTAEEEKPSTPAAVPAADAEELAAEEDEPAEPADPELLRVHLMDGSVIAGKLLLKQLEMETQFGKLQVPLAQLRGFTPGLANHPKLNQKLAELIEQIGSPETQLRQKAARALLQMGSSVRAELEKHALDADQQRRSEVRKLLEELAEETEDEAGQEQPDSSGEQPLIQADAIETSEFTAVGQIVTKSFPLASSYGELTVKLTDIRKVDRPLAKRPPITKVLVVDSNQMPHRGLKSVEIRVERGDRVSISASGKLTMSPWGEGLTSTPDGGANFGWYTDNVIPNGALIASIGTAAAPFKTGCKHSFRAQRSGVLRFGIAMQPDYANQDFPGNYRVKVRVEKR